MLPNLPSARSTGASVLFLGSALITAAIAVWANNLNLSSSQAGNLASIFVLLFTTLDSAGANCCLLILIAGVLVARRQDVRPLLGWIADHPGIVAVATFVALCLGSLLVYRNYPLSMDEYAAYFQSQAFAAGHLAGQLPPALLDWLVPPEFQNLFLFVSHATGRVASAYWPSHALLLTPFTFMGIPWAFNPAISAATVLAIHRLGCRIFADRETAGLAVLLTVASPVFCADGISYYSMSAHLLANALFALLLLEPTALRACIAGVVGSLALTMHNPVPHMLFAAPWIVWLLARRGGIALTGWLILGYAPLSLLLGVGWFLFSTGLPHEGVALAASSQLTQRFAARTASAFASPTVTLLIARLIGVAKIVVWAVPGMLILAAAGAWKWRHNIPCRLLALSAVATLLGFLYVPVDQGHGWGFRYFHSAWLALPLLAAGALQKSGRGSEEISQPSKIGRGSIFEDAETRTFLVACALLTLVCGNGWRAYQIHSFISMNLAQLPVYEGKQHRVVIIDPHVLFYGMDLVRNDPWLRGGVVGMITHGNTADAAMMQAQFPQMRRVVAGPSGSVWAADSQQAAVGGPDRVPE